jgi:N-methylhydantoinase A
VASYTIGSDIGGTFTDTVVVERASGRLQQFKAPTTPGDVRHGILATLRQAAVSEGLSLDELLSAVALFSHGTTVATNAFLERRGARTGLIQTQGFGDTLAIMRAGRAAGLTSEEVKRFSRLVKPRPIVERALIAEVAERVDYRGRVLAPLDEDDARAAVRALIEQDVESIAVCLLWSFRNDAHERLLADIIAEEAPDVYVTLSSELVPRIKEYERTATTAINSYVGPVLRRSLAGLESDLARQGLATPPLLMQSNGGLAGVEASIAAAATTLMSGPAGGVTGSSRLGRLLGYPNIVTTDMGGTTFDVGLVVDGEPLMLSRSVFDQYTTCLPSVAITSIGAGGGSIARVRHGYLEVGPDSAGASPGPACYGRGGTLPTVTDADLALGIIDPANFLGGQLRVDRDASLAAIEEHVAAPLGVGVLEAASAIRTITDNKMADLIRRVTIERGHDPRDFVVFAFGGGGPTHACSYGSEVQARAIVIPQTAAVHSAFGIATADLQVTHELSRPMITPPGGAPISTTLTREAFNEPFAQLDEKVRSALRRQDVEDADIQVSRQLDMRFRGQIYEVAVTVQSEPFSDADVDGLAQRFVMAYETLYGEGSALAEAGIEFITFRSTATAATPKPATAAKAARAYGRLAPSGRRAVYLPERGELTELPTFSGADLCAGDIVGGPAIVELPATTVLLGAGQTCAVDSMLNLVITTEA